MKLKPISRRALHAVTCAALSLIFASAHAGGMLRVRFDQDFYFQNKDRSTIPLQVVNEGEAIAFVDLTIAPGEVKGKQVAFDTQRPVTIYDLFPATVAIPPGKSKTIRLVRHAGPLDDQFSLAGHEEYYRLRAIPQSADEALKANPALWEQLSDNERQSVQDAASSTAGTLQLNIGSGSVLVVQSGAPLALSGIHVQREVMPDAMTVDFRNDTSGTLRFQDMRAVAGVNWIPVTEGALVLRAGQSRSFSLNRDQLQRLGAELKQPDDITVTFKLQDGTTYEVGASNTPLKRLRQP